MSLQSKINVLILSATATFYKGEAFGISAVNDVGPFDVLEGHRSFITLVRNKVVVHKTDKDKVEIPVNRGVLTVKGNQVNVYVGF